MQITQLNATDVEAVVQKPMSTFFANVFNVSSATVAARAVSSIQYPGELCILALNETESSTINITGTGIVNVECGVQANSCFGNPGGSGGGTGAIRVAGTGSDPAGFYTKWAGACGTKATPGKPTVEPDLTGYVDSDPKYNPGMTPTASPFRDSSTGLLTRDEPDRTLTAVSSTFMDVTIDGVYPDLDGLAARGRRGSS